MVAELHQEKVHGQGVVMRVVEEESPETREYLGWGKMFERIGQDNMMMPITPITA